MQAVKAKNYATAGTLARIVMEMNPKKEVRLLASICRLRLLASPHLQVPHCATARGV